jgi:two-component system, response regulator YesN
LIKPLENYYKSLNNVGSTSRALADVFVNIFANPHLESHFLTIDSNHAEKNKEVLPVQDVEQKEKNINFIYELEKKYLHCIETGEPEKALAMIVDYSDDLDYRVPGNPLRARKNVIFGSNSIFIMAISNISSSEMVTDCSILMENFSEISCKYWGGTPPLPAVIL